MLSESPPAMRIAANTAAIDCNRIHRLRHLYNKDPAESAPGIRGIGD
jgi:hypothetical protein